ncbi:MAG TPA: hypothetical protein PK152_17955, partial [Anaerolineales bacterium]|nr:hypothetical protein [Anaerolineales bacterium]
GILHKTKIPAIYVTHDQEEAFTIADRILVLHEGTIIRDAAPQEIWKEPQYAAVAKLLGIGNIIDAEIISDKKVRTEFGTFDINCANNIGEKVQLLIQEFPSPSGRGVRGEGEAQIQLTVEDVLFKQDQFQVKARGGIVIHMKEAPKVDDVITVQVQVKCLS